MRWAASSQEYRVLTALEKEVPTLFDAGIFELDFNDLYTRFVIRANENFIETNEQYSKDKKVFDAVALPHVSVDHDMMSAKLDRLRSIKDELTWFQTHDDELTSLFGTLYQKETTDTANLEQLVAQFKQLTTCADAMREIKSITTHVAAESDEHHTLFGSHFTGISTDWSHILDNLSLTQSFISQLQSHGINSDAIFVTKACEDANFAAICTHFAEDIRTTLDQTTEYIEWFSSLFSDADTLTQLPITTLIEKVSACSNDPNALQDWIDYRTIRQECSDTQLNACIDALENDAIAPDHIVPVFKKRLYRLWLDSILPEYPLVANFRHRNQKKSFQNFASSTKIK